MAPGTAWLRDSGDNGLGGGFAGEKRMKMQHVFEVELAELANGLDVRSEGWNYKRKRMIPKFLALINEGIATPLTTIEKMG